jgi:hypothetical protein
MADSRNLIRNQNTLVRLLGTLQAVSQKFSRLICMGAQGEEVASKVLRQGEIFSIAHHFAASQDFHDMFVAT